MTSALDISEVRNSFNFFEGQSRGGFHHTVGLLDICFVNCTSGGGGEVLRSGLRGGVGNHFSLCHDPDQNQPSMLCFVPEGKRKGTLP